MKIAPWKLKIASLGIALSTMLLPGCGDSGDSLAQLVQEQVNSNPAPAPNTAAPILSYNVVNTYPHATDAFTQGLVYENNFLYESTGLVGQSSLREVGLTTGQVLRQVSNDPTVFAEGLAARAGSLYQLTLDSGTATVWTRGTFTIQNQLTSRIPAWGLAYSEGADRFAFSDGTSTIRFLLPNFEETGSVKVTDNGVEVTGLNELEFVGGLLYANRFLTDEIVAIDPNTGRVVYRINLAGIINKQAYNLGANDVLNGIAYDAATDRLFVTGKRWPFLYQITLKDNI